MPEFESRTRSTAQTKKRKKKKENVFVAIVKGLFPCKGDKAGDVIRKLVFLVSIAVLVYAAISILYFYVIRDAQTDAEREYWAAQKELNHTDDVITISLKDSDGSDSGETEEVEVLEEYVSYYEQNNDFVGWISIYPYITYPVVQTTDNEYYLKHNFNGDYTENGTIFADYEGPITADSVPPNIILYGHNLLTKNNFQPLKHYREDIQFLKDNYLITFDTLYERGQYLIFSVFLTNTKEEHGEVFTYQNDVFFENEQEFNDYVTECLDRSYYYTGVDLQYGDELLTLSTCDFSMFSDMRLVVVARKLRDGESPVLDTETFIDNTGFDEEGNVKRKMFQAYYDLYTTTGEWAGRNWDTSYVKGLTE